MEAKYQNRLNLEAQELVGVIENHIEKEIQVEVDESQPERLACEVDKRVVKIVIPFDEYFPQSSVMHELIHIRRFSVDGVPKIVICDTYEDWSPQLETNLIKLDNDLEHLHVVPEELLIFPERNQYWEGKIDRILDMICSNNLTEPRAQSTALFQWIFLHRIFPESKLLTKVDRIIDSLDIAAEVHECSGHIEQYINEKDKLTRVLFENIAIPPKSGCLEYLDCKNQTSEIVTVASIQI